VHEAPGAFRRGVLQTRLRGTGACRRSRDFAASIRLSVLVRRPRLGGRLDARPPRAHHPRAATPNTAHRLLQSMRSASTTAESVVTPGLGLENESRARGLGALLRRAAQPGIFGSGAIAWFPARMASSDAIARVASFAPARLAPDTSCRGPGIPSSVEYARKSPCPARSSRRRARAPDCSGGALPTSLREENSYSTHRGAFRRWASSLEDGPIPQAVSSVWRTGQALLQSPQSFCTRGPVCGVAATRLETEQALFLREELEPKAALLPRRGASSDFYVPVRSAARCAAELPRA
jgi:hypothetical protein